MMGKKNRKELLVMQRLKNSVPARDHQTADIVIRCI